MNLPALLSRLQGVKKAGDGFLARCPAHDDHDPSLSVSNGDGKILIHCQAECPIENVLAALGLELKDLYIDESPTSQKRISKTYDYQTATGELLYQKVRYQPKDFRIRRPDGNGGYVWNLNGIERVLYNFPNVLKAIEADETVFIVEGEKDADNLNRLGLTATTNIEGAGKWKDEYSETLKGLRAAIIPDNDKPGHEHAEKVAASLNGKALSIKLANLPG
ncbi:hypothetical protein ACFLU6_09750, partial [Acidobacteriota bacterium]